MELDRDALRTRIAALFQQNFTEGGELGAAVSIWQDGELLLHEFGGFVDRRRVDPWTPETAVLFWSATKGLGAACLLHVLQEARVDLGRKVSEFWPEFAQAGKAGISIGELMSHQAGLPALDDAVELLDYRAVITALERQSAEWVPGTAHGYHARTFGFLLDELVRRLAGVTLGEYWRKVFAEPLRLDLWIGLPPAKNRRVATIYAAKAGKPPQPVEFYKSLAVPGSLARRTFNSPRGLHSVSAMNTPETRAHAIVSMSGIGTALALGKFYSLLANRGELDGQRFFKEETIAQMTTTLSCGVDRVFGIPTAFSAGFMKDPPETTRRIFGSSALGFGHPGAGGSHAFADPATGLSFAYVMNQMEQSLLPNEKSLRLVDALVESAVTSG